MGRSADERIVMDGLGFDWILARLDHACLNMKEPKNDPISKKHDPIDGSCLTTQVSSSSHVHN